MSKSGGQAKTLAGLMGIILRAREKKQPPQEKLNEVKAVSPELDSSTTLKDDAPHNKSWVKRNSNTLRTASSLHRVHKANPSLVDYTSTLSHTKNPTQFDLNPLKTMISDTKQWKLLIKAKLAENKQGAHVTSVAPKRMFSAKANINTRTLQYHTTKMHTTFSSTP